MLIHNLEQGSQEWLQLRLGVATASNFDKIITATGKESSSLEKYALELATQKMLITPEESYKSEAMLRGNELEPIARQYYQEENLCVVKQVGFITTDCGNIGYSPDGLVDEDGLIEIKCPLSHNHTKYLLDNKMPSEYWQQVQGGLWISGRKWIDFVSFHPNFKDKKMFKIRVDRDEVYISKMKELVEKTISLRDDILITLKNR